VVDPGGVLGDPVGDIEGFEVVGEGEVHRNSSAGGGGAESREEGFYREERWEGEWVAGAFGEAGRRGGKMGDEFAGVAGALRIGSAIRRARRRAGVMLAEEPE
jgi:hypothetical protein